LRRQPKGPLLYMNRPFYGVKLLTNSVDFDERTTYGRNTQRSAGVCKEQNGMAGHGLARFQVVDAGVDVSPDKFLDLIKTHKPDIVSIGSSMSTTLPALKKTVDAIKSTGTARKVVVGGVAVSKTWADEAGADGYADDARSYVNLCKIIMGKEPPATARSHAGKKASSSGKKRRGEEKSNDSTRL